MAGVNFHQKGWFTNFSGDISGCFLEVASLGTTQAKPTSEFLPDVLREITQYQQEDGHYGAEVDWTKPMDTNVDTHDAVMMISVTGG
ncbi:MAG: hypothetical protein Q4G68_13520 [Planctomycetia bacterium]|nr:hypothetical protein [Planctomycetia bacterium]